MEDTLMLIYICSAILSMSGYAKTEKSEAYKLLGPPRYYLNALFVSVIPVVNTFLGIGFIFEFSHFVWNYFRKKQQ